MSTVIVCPGVHLLRTFSRGELGADRSERMRRHLAECPSCRATLEGIEATEKADSPDEVGWTETGMSSTAPASDETVPHVPGTTAVVAPKELGYTVRGDEGDGPDTDLDLSFLLPTARPNALGRIAEYDILNVLGRGGMGVVFKAYDTALHRIVAIKVLAPELAGSRRARRQFLREARAAAGISHPNVVTIHAVGTQGGTPYLVMECIGGQSLRYRIRESNKAPVLAEVLRIGMQAAEGLAAAHVQGIIHRDIKPANLMLEDGVERVKITDFGLALAALHVSDMTSSEKIVGTPAYMSPEQVRGEVLDPRSDLFSLGATLYAIYAGGSPFRGPHALETVRRVCDLHPAPLRELDPSVPEALSELVTRMLAKAPEDRPASAAEVADSLRGLLAQANLEPPPSGEHDLLATTATAPRPRRKGRRAESLVGVLALAFLLVAAALYFWPGPRGQDREPGARGPEGISRPAPPTGKVTLRVGPGADADYRTLAEALEHAGPGSTIRLEEGAHDGRVLVNDPARWDGLTIEPVGWGTDTAPEPLLTWAGGSSQAVVELRDTPNVTVRGVAIESIDAQHAVFIGGQAEGVTIEKVRFRKKAGTRRWAHLLISEDARGSLRAPIRLLDSLFEAGTMGVVVGDDSGRVVASVRVEGNRFAGAGPHLMLMQNLSDVRVTGNVFVGGTGVTLDLKPGRLETLVLANNSFFQSLHWLENIASDPNLSRVEVVNNAIFGSESLNDGSLVPLAGSWRFAKNLWESGADRGSPLADRGGRIEVLSRDPSNPDFLRPAPGSALLGAGAGGELPDYIGALGPPSGRGR